MTIAGISFSGRSQNSGMVFIKLKDWKLRDRPDLKDKAIAQRAMMKLSTIRNAMGVRVFRRRPCRNWACPRASTSSCWTAAGWATRP
jgi:multidrug efflux pump subunit AcrB